MNESTQKSDEERVECPYCGKIWKNELSYQTHASLKHRTDIEREKHYREVHKRWKQTHKEQVEEQWRRYYQTHKQQINERRARYQQTHKEQVRKYHQTHKPQRRERLWKKYGIHNSNGQPFNYDDFKKL